MARNEELIVILGLAEVGRKKYMTVRVNDELINLLQVQQQLNIIVQSMHIHGMQIEREVIMIPLTSQVSKKSSINSFMHNVTTIIASRLRYPPGKWEVKIDEVLQQHISRLR